VSMTCRVLSATSYRSRSRERLRSSRSRSRERLRSRRGERSPPPGPAPAPAPGPAPAPAAEGAPKRRVISAARMAACVPAVTAACCANNQGLKLVHLAAQLKRILWNRGKCRGGNLGVV